MGYLKFARRAQAIFEAFHPYTDRPLLKLTDMLKEKGWTVRRVKEDGGCYEVYGLDDKGQRVEAYFHPVTLAPVPTKAR